VLSQRGASSEAAKWLAANENAADLVGGVSLDDKDRMLKTVLLDLSQAASLDASIELGNSVLRGLRSVGRVHHATRAVAGLHGAQIAGYPVDPGRDCVHLQPGRREAACAVSHYRQKARARDF
jgi:hypothetical protein